MLYSLGQAGLETIWICDEPGHVHIFEKGETSCPVCQQPKSQCATQATVSIRETLSHELRSPVTCLKLLDYLSSGINLYNALTNSCTDHCNPFPETFELPDIMAESWDAKRFFDLSWFLDPRVSWKVPEQCPV